MKDSEVAGAITTAVLITIMITAFFSSMFTGCAYDSAWEADAIRNGAGYYHPETGRFTWNQRDDP